jgi:adenosylhomocysteine nucleosidase
LTTAVLGVVCALRSEARHLGRTLSRHPHIEALPDGKLLAVTGMGGEAALRGAETLVACGAAALASFGLAGALDPQLRAGCIFLPNEVSAVDGAREVTDPAWRVRLQTALTGRVAAEGGRLITMRRPVAGVAAKAALFAASGARAVDMESCDIGAVARRHALPFIAVRAIVDEADAELPACVLASTAANGDTSPWRLLTQLLRRPRELAPLLRLLGGYRHASRSLAAVARTASLWPPADGPS